MKRLVYLSMMIVLLLGMLPSTAAAKPPETGSPRRLEKPSVDAVTSFAPPRATTTVAENARWNALGTGISGGDIPVVQALAVDGGGVLFAGGHFTTAGAVPAANIALWNGSAWSPLGTGVAAGSRPGCSNTLDFIEGLAAFGSDLVAGGTFATAGGLTAGGIAKWSGSAWSELGGGIGINCESPYALAVDGSNLYVGGEFTTAGTVPASNIAKWDGTSWTALGNGISGAGSIVRALAVDGSDLYVGGSFTTAGAVPASNIAKWDLAENQLQRISLVTGWNLVSFRLHPADTSITSVLTSINGQYSLVYAWDAAASSWLIYDPTLGNLNDLKNLMKKWASGSR